MEKMLEDCDYSRWEPKNNEAYFYVASDGTVEQDWRVEEFASVDKKRYDFYNCFPTCEKAEQEAEKMLVRRMLEDIARRLNKGNKIDWNNDKQFKYFICIDGRDNEIIWDREVRYISQGIVYCLDINFCNVAIQEIGEQRLKAYLKGE